MFEKGELFNLVPPLACRVIDLLCLRLLIGINASNFNNTTINIWKKKKTIVEFDNKIDCNFGNIVDSRHEMDFTKLPSYQHCLFLTFATTGQSNGPSVVLCLSI